MSKSNRGITEKKAKELLKTLDIILYEGGGSRRGVLMDALSEAKLEGEKEERNRIVGVVKRWFVEGSKEYKAVERLAYAIENKWDSNPSEIIGEKK